MTLEVTESEGITKAIFVKQRLRNFVDNTFDDVFAAVCTPAQLEDLQEGSPADGSSYFRASKVDIITRNADYLQEVFNSIAAEVTALTNSVSALQLLGADEAYQVVSDTEEWVPVESGGGGTGGSVTIATQAEAIAGTNNTHVMTPLRTTQAMAGHGFDGTVTDTNTNVRYRLVITNGVLGLEQI